MNRLIIENDNVVSAKLDDSIVLERVQKNEDFFLNQIKLIVRADASLTIEYKSTQESKLNVVFVIQDHVKFNILEVRFGKRMKIQYRYYLARYSEVFSQKIYFVEGMREVLYADLNAEGAKFTSILKTVSVEEEKYDYAILHNAKNTVSEIVNHGINLHNGCLTFNVTGVIQKGNTGSMTNEVNRILTFNEKECKIAPNLLIDEEDVIANHSAYIGKFKDEELFYFMSRGIPEDEATRLLTTGFLLSRLEINKKIKDRISKKLKTVWR